MSHRTPTDTDRSRATLGQRCARLGLPLARLDPDAQPRVIPMTDNPAAAAFLASPVIGALLDSAASKWADADAPDAVELWPGLNALPLAERRRRRHAGWLVVFIITAAALESDQFAAACAAAGLDIGAARAALAPIVSVAPSDLAATHDTLRWMWDDQRAAANAAIELAGFSRQLTETFEEVSLLYRLSSEMNELVHPERFVRHACEELHATLSFHWVAAAFLRSTAAARSMAGRVIVAGASDQHAERARRIATWTLDDLIPGEGIVLSGLEAQVAGAGPREEILVRPISRKGAIVGAIVACDKRGEDPHVSSVDLKLVSAAASTIGVLLENAALYEDQQAMFLGTLGALTASIDAKDRYTRGHSERVAMLTRGLAAAAGIDDATVHRFHIAGLVHDVGKIGVPESVLRKAGRLTEDEFAHIKRHPEIGYRILRDIPQLADVLPGVLHHHERWDGKGYPAGLAGDAIPLVARMIALADAFDAMSSTRTYRPAMPRERVLSEIRRGAGAQFDPDLAARFLTIDLAEYDDLVARHEHADISPGAVVPAHIPPPTAEAA